MLISILGLGAGATYGIANFLLAALAEDKSHSFNHINLTHSNATKEYGPWHFTINSEEASWIGMLFDNFDSVTINSQLYFSTPISLNLILTTYLFHNSASFGSIGQYFPIFFVGPLMSKFGKRISLMVDSVLFVTGFLLMTLAIDVRMLYAAKFLFGKSIHNKHIYIHSY